MIYNSVVITIIEYYYIIQICRYYLFRENNPALIDGVHPFAFGKISDEQILTVVPYKDQEERKMIFFRIGNLI
jgi:hypothetical protein